MKAKLTFFFLLLAVPQLSLGLCVFDKDPVQIDVRFTECSSEQIKGYVLGGELDSTDSNALIRFEHLTPAANSCEEYPLEQQIRVLMRRNCCDTPNIPNCPFGWIDRRLDDLEPQ